MAFLNDYWVRAHARLQRLHRQHVEHLAGGALPPEEALQLPAAREGAAGERRRGWRGRNYFAGPGTWAFGCLRKVEQIAQSRRDTALWRCAGWLSENYFTALGTGEEPDGLGGSGTGRIDVRVICIKGSPEQRPLAECLRTPKPHRPPPFLHVPGRLDWKWPPSWPVPQGSPAGAGMPPGCASYSREIRSSTKLVDLCLEGKLDRSSAI